MADLGYEAGFAIVDSVLGGVQWRSALNLKEDFQVQTDMSSSLGCWIYFKERWPLARHMAAEKHCLRPDIPGFFFPILGGLWLCVVVFFSYSRAQE